MLESSMKLQPILPFQSNFISLIRISSHQKSRDPWTFNKYIEDKYKIKIVYLLLKVLRFHNQNSGLASLMPSPPASSFVHSTSRHFVRPASSACANEQLMNTCKILAKSLQGLENLIASIQRLPGEQQPQNNSANWLQAHTEYFQLGDILANAKVS